MPKVKHSQVFFRDQNILKKIVDTAQIKEGDWILEIGPGKGYLTSELLKAGANVLSIEIDKDLYGFLQKEFLLFLNDRFFLVNEDFLKVNIEEFLERYGIKEIRVVSNIPYHITTPIFEKIIYNRSYFPEVFLTIQREVAERIVAKPGGKEYGSLSIFVNLYYDASIAFNISRHSFSPVPKVDSSFLKMIRKETREDYSKFERFVRALFQGRRKKIRTLLRSLGLYDVSMEGSLQQFLDKRPENLTPSELYFVFRECLSIKN